MNKKNRSIFTIAFTLITLTAGAQSSQSFAAQPDSFFTITRNKTWKINKYLMSSNQLDKTSIFSNVTFVFNQKDSNNFLIQIPGRSDTTGKWFVQYNNSIRFSMPLLPFNPANTDSLYNERVNLLCSWPMQKIVMNESLIKFKMSDPFKGDALIEFTRKD